MKAVENTINGMPVRQEDDLFLALPGPLPAGFMDVWVFRCGGGLLRVRIQSRNYAVLERRGRFSLEDQAVADAWVERVLKGIESGCSAPG